MTAGGMEGFLITVMVVMTILIMIASVYVLVYFQSEDDKNTAWAPKIAVILGLTLTCLLVLMLPLDVANRSTASGLPMADLWQGMYLAVAIMCIGVVPFQMFYYEAWDPESNTWQLWTAIKYEFCTVFIVGMTLVLLYLACGYADVPLDVISYNASHLAAGVGPAAALLPAGTPATCATHFCAGPPEATSLRIPVTPTVYLIALVAFCGWFLFTLFVGVGLVAVRSPTSHQPTTHHQPSPHTHTQTHTTGPPSHRPFTTISAFLPRA
jgi:LMBR1 domain-containing protein 1